jgi:hypothetical protein
MGGNSAGGGSVMGQLITEGTFLQHPNPTFVDSPFGQRYVSAKPKALIQNDVLVRSCALAFTIRGYADTGTVDTLNVQGTGDAELLLQDWYTLVRDMAKRSLKYKHLPTTLTDVDVPI